MKKVLVLLIIVVILPMFSLSASAEGEAGGYISEFENILPESLSGITEADNLAEMVSIKGLISNLFSAIRGESSGAIAFFLQLLGCVALISAAETLGGKMGEEVGSAVGIVSSILIFSSIRQVHIGVSESLNEVSSFFASLIPITAGVTALGGGNATAATQSSAMYMTVSLIGRFGFEIFGAIISLGLAVALLSAFGAEEITAISRGIRGVFFWLLGIFTTLITGSFALQTLVSTAQDSMSIRAAKYMASGLIPVVGSTVSGALSTLASGLSYAKGIIGTGAVVGLICLIISPLATMLLYRLALSVAIMISDFVGKGAAKILSAYRFSLDLLVALYALSALIYIFEIVLFIKIGVALL